MLSASARTVDRLIDKAARSRRRFAVMVCLAALTGLCFAASAIAGLNVYCNNCILNPGEAIGNFKFNNWTYNEMYPSDSTLPSGIYMEEVNGTKFGTVNGIGFISWSSAGTGYGDGFCWNRSASYQALISDCYDQA